VTDAQKQFETLMCKPERFTEENIQEFRQLFSQMAYGAFDLAQVGRAEIRSIIELIDSIRAFDRASGEMVAQGNRINKWVLRFAIVAAILAFAAVIISWLSYRLAVAQLSN
jgi:hypothetical protein